ncbi:MAG: hypothetical protein IPL62_08025 [Caulobacteraceae bacterium]|nr:hypothetical protein [Caulobacteraceae bacterium]
MLSNPRFPWYVNSEVKMQTLTPLLTREPVLTFQRYDARLEIDEEEFRRPEHVESLLGQTLKPKVVEQLRKLDIKDPGIVGPSLSHGRGAWCGAADASRVDRQQSAHQRRDWA